MLAFIDALLIGGYAVNPGADRNPLPVYIPLLIVFVLAAALCFFIAYRQNKKK